jgi:hypothetical protein
VLVEVLLTGGSVLADAAGEQRLRVSKQVLLQLVFAVKALVAQVAVEGPLVHHAVLDEVGAGCKLLVTHVAGVGAVAVVQVLVLHQDVLVAKAAVADVALVWLLTHMRQSDVADEAVLVAKLLVAQGALECAILGCCCFGEQC